MKYSSILNQFTHSNANEHEKFLAYKFFTYGIMHAINDESEQVPALLKGHTPQQAPADTLTKADIDYLVGTIAGSITDLHNLDATYADEIAVVWERCDKEQPEKTANAFTYLNAVKDNRRAIKRHIKRISAIQRKLKKYR